MQLFSQPQEKYQIKVIFFTDIFLKKWYTLAEGKKNRSWETLHKNTKDGAEVYHMKSSKSKKAEEAEAFTSDIKAVDIQGAMIKDSRP